ncbi:MAG: hypothetical protein HGA67_03110 [Candidatus Yonathbacteria bacterium]|nr:hypothetical protein [Candidatus Yonathbacteria bacterium]
MTRNESMGPSMAWYATVVRLAEFFRDYQLLLGMCTVEDGAYQGKAKKFLRWCCTPESLEVNMANLEKKSAELPYEKLGKYRESLRELRTCITAYWQEDESED